MTVKLRVFSFTLLLAASSFATTFVVPDDAELIAKSRAIVVGTIELAEAQRTADGVETSYSLRLERVLKGNLATARPLWIVSPGGNAGGLAQAVDGAAHFTVGDRALLFLVFESGRWQVTDWAVGKFRFVAAPSGNLLARDGGAIAGWDRAGRPYVERERMADGFLKFIENTVAGKPGPVDYFVDGEGGGTASPASAPKGIVANTVYSSYTYSSGLVDGAGNVFPGRWTTATMAGGVNVYKNSTQNASGLSDGGVQTIRNALASWTNDGGSEANLSYAGTSSSTKSVDGVNVVTFNDPGNWIPGTWTGSGIIASTYSSGSGFHTFDGRSDWSSYYDADIVFQDGFPGTDTNFVTALTHEVGHLIGIRHSNKNWSDNGTCNSSVEECTSSAIMNSSVVPSYGYTLQTYDQNAVRSLYPSASCTDPYEPNESSTTAYGPIAEGSYLGKICTASDVDWFKADFTAGTTVTLTLSVPSNNDYDLEIYGPDANWKAGSNNGTGATETINYAVPTSGRYSIRIYGYQGSFNTSTWYSLGYSSSGGTRTLNVSRSGTGNGTVTSSPAGINCGGTCSSSFAYNTAVTLSASAAPGSTFAGWSGEGCSGTGTCQVTMTQTRNVTAQFNTAQCAYSISPASASGAGGGGSGAIQVSGSPSGCSGSWSASTASTFLSLTGTASGSGSGTWSVPYSYTPNPSTTSTRQATVSFSGSFPSGGTFTLTQDPSPVNNQPNLAPYQPSGWSGKIVVSRVAGTHTDDVLRAGDSLYLDWAVINNGNASCPSGVYFDLYVDGTLTASWLTNYILGAGSYAYVEDYNFGPLSTGTHTITLIADSTNVASESNESDNVYSKTIRVGAGEGADFNGDKKSDLVLQSSVTRGITVWLMDGLNPFAGAQIDIPPAGWVPVAAGDVDGDGFSDIVIRNSSTGIVDAYLMASSGLAVKSFIGIGGSSLNETVVGMADFDHNGTDDLLLHDSSTGQIAIWYMRAGGGILGTALLGGAASPWKAVAIGDFDGDGWSDLILQNTSTAQILEWRVVNGNIVATAIVGTPPVGWSMIAAGDVNGDGHDDLILQHSTGVVAVLTMNGLTPIEIHNVGTPGSSWVCKGRGDFNGDGVADIVLQDSTTHSVQVWQMSGGNVAYVSQRTVKPEYDLKVSK